MKLSILIPCYNTELYLRQCLDSIKAQTLTDFEAICINDGSNDATREILEEYAQADARFTIIDKENSGYGDSMNLALAKACGEYIGIVEPDDWIEPEMFALLCKKADECNADLVRSSYFFEKASTSSQRGGFKNLPDEFTPTEHLLQAFALEPAIWSCLVRRSLLKQHQVSFLPTPGAAFQDTSFSFKCMLYASHMALILKPLYHYRIHENNSVKKGGKINNVLIEWQEILRVVEEEGRLSEFSGNLYILQYRTFKWNYLRLPDHEATEFLKNWKAYWQQLVAKIPLSQIPLLKIRIYAWLLLNFTRIFEHLLKRKRKVA